MKQRFISTLEAAAALEREVLESGRQALSNIIASHNSGNAPATLWHIKFECVGCDPLDRNRPLNFIEQINQTFTYLASARAVGLLLELHPQFAPFKLNLGTERGSDIESNDPSKVACEVFASVKHSNNRKLIRDVDKVGAIEAEHKYVFFMCPGFQVGRQLQLEKYRDDVQVWSVGDEQSSWIGR